MLRTMCVCVCVLQTEHFVLMLTRQHCDKSVIEMISVLVKEANLPCYESVRSLSVVLELFPTATRSLWNHVALPTDCLRFSVSHTKTCFSTPWLRRTRFIWDKRNNRERGRGRDLLWEDGDWKNFQKFHPPVLLEVTCQFLFYRSTCSDDIYNPTHLLVIKTAFKQWSVFVLFFWLFHNYNKTSSTTWSCRFVSVHSYNNILTFTEAFFLRLKLDGIKDQTSAKLLIR